MQQDGLPQGVRDVRREAADQVGLGGGEAERTVVPVQAQVAQQWPPTTSAARNSSPSPTGRMIIHLTMQAAGTDPTAPAPGSDAGRYGSRTS